MSEPTHTVLVADDDKAVRESLRALLHAEGYQVVSVANGAEALKSIRWEPDRIDLLLVDLNMPLKNGWATLDRLLEVNPSLPVVVVTGQANQTEMAEAAGVNGLVEKPIDVPALLALIKELLTEPAGSALAHAGAPRRPFHLIRPSGYAARYRCPDNVTPYRYGGLNE